MMRSICSADSPTEARARTHTHMYARARTHTHKLTDDMPADKNRGETCRGEGARGGGGRGGGMCRRYEISP